MKQKKEDAVLKEKQTLDAKIIELESLNHELINKMTELELDKEIAEDLGSAKAELLQEMIEQFDLIGQEFRLVINDLHDTRDELKKELEITKIFKEQLIETLEEARERFGFK